MGNLFFGVAADTAARQGQDLAGDLRFTLPAYESAASGGLFQVKSGVQAVDALHELAPARVAGVVGRPGFSQAEFGGRDAANLADADTGAYLGRPGVFHFHAVETRQ